MKTPKYIIKFLRWFCNDQSIDEIEGDLVELYKRRSIKNPTRANLLLLLEVISSFRLINLKKFSTSNSIKIRNYFKIGWRFLIKEKIYTAFNIVSLSLGIVFFILFIWYYDHETSFDEFHEKSDRIYRVSFTEYFDLGTYATTSYPIANAIANEYPEIEMFTRFTGGGRQIIKTDEQKIFQEVYFVDEDFFKIFDFDLISGNPAKVLSEPNKVVISQSTAQKYFGSGNPIGRELRIGAEDEFNSEVTGVFRDVPSNSQLQFDILISYKTFEKKYPWFKDLWKQMPSNYTYVLCEAGVDISNLIGKLDGIKEKYVGKIEQGDYKLTLLPLGEIHLSSVFKRELPNKGNMTSLYVFGIISITILIIAWINYVNLTSSRFMKRLKELGIRKAMGAEKIDLITQLIIQSFLIVVLSICFSLIAITFLLPIINDLIGINIQLADLNNNTVWISLVAITFISILFAGVIPAIGISSGIVKNALRSSQKIERSIGWKKGLLIIQVTASITLITASLIINKQMNFIQQKIGKDNIVVVPINQNISDNFEVLKSKLNQYGQITGISASSSVPSYSGDSWSVRRDLNANSVQTENYSIDEFFPEIMSYQVIAGRSLSSKIESDKSSGFLINETAVRELGFDSPEKAIGETIFWAIGTNTKRGSIVGVIKDFHFNSFHNEIKPALMQFQPFKWMSYNFLILKTNSNDFSSLRMLIQESINEIDNSWIAELSFFDDNFRRLHIKEIAQGELIVLFSIIAVIISCIGQIGLMIHTALSRQKEIAIRRILGAKIIQNWLVITKEYLVLLFVSIILSVPLSYFLMENWLAGFAYKIVPGLQPFFLSSFVGVTLMIIILSIISIRTALINPINLIKEE